MIFYSIPFLIFFLVLLILFTIIKGANKKEALLFVSSIFFYAYWDVRFVALLFFLAIVNYYLGNRLYIAEITKRKRILALGITINLLVLGAFKYLNFFIDNANTILSRLGFEISTLSILLPLGISFFIFELISYLADIYRGKISACHYWLDFFTFVFFFPRLASGPIIRPADFLPQLEQEIIIEKDNLIGGFQIFLLGLFKKLVIADTMALFVDQIFLNPPIYSSATVWLAVIAYSVQIYCDFSGYSDMAIGLAKIIGFKLPVNFNMPYISQNVTELWKRWHISLSSWLGDYLYISLGGNRKGTSRKNYNLLITMLLGGLWHGASWNFVFWGGLHGIALILHKTYANASRNWMFKELGIYKLLSWVLTYFFVCICWIFFRSGSFATSLEVLESMFIALNTPKIVWIMPQVFIMLAITVMATLIKIYWNKKNNSKQYMLLDLSKLVNIFILVAILVCTFFMCATNPSPFIYFQF
jgi:alginate O-acetyltransferase complex protein AlgI